MEPLDKEENEILKLICAESTALEDFLIESSNPRFLPFLNGRNDKNLNIFQNGFDPQATQWKDHSVFWLPAIYLERISNRLRQESDVSDSVRQEYVCNIQQALEDIIKGYDKENKKDLDVVQLLLHIIQTQHISSLDNRLIDFIIINLKMKNLRQ